jgi:hypothetical protein
MLLKKKKRMIFCAFLTGLFAVRICSFGYLLIILLSKSNDIPHVLLQQAHVSEPSLLEHRFRYFWSSKIIAGAARFLVVV